MKGDNRLCMAIAVVGLVLGIWGDVLFQDTFGVGLNAVGWTVALIGGCGCVMRRVGPERGRAGRYFAICAVLFSLCLAWRDSATLHALDVAAVLASLSLMAAYAVSGDVVPSTLQQFIKSLAVSAGNVLIGGGGLFMEIDWDAVRGRPLGNSVTPAIRGVAVAVPLVLVFGSLFSEADPVYAHFAAKLFDWDASAIVTRLGWMLVIGWGTMGFLRYALVNRVDAEAIGVKTASGGFLGSLEVTLILGALDLLFLSFVVVQIRYLFGGASLIHATIGVTFAQYARTGFFQLADASALLLPVLVILHWAKNREDAAAARSFLWLGGLLICLLFVVMASAMERMHLYELAFGLTELRVYTVVFMGWLALVFVWMTATVLRGRSGLFASGALTAALAALFCLNAINPDALIVSTNARLASRTHHFDGCYAATLGDDAVPALAAYLPHLDPPTQAIIAQSLLTSASPPSHIDWRTWNLDKAIAWNIAESRTPVLREMIKNLPANACQIDNDD